jgi:DNA-binding transcriptional LysR family regulator
MVQIGKCDEWQVVMDFRQLKTFQMAAQTLSFTQAAAILSFAQSSVTAQIQALEEELGTPLFDRVGRRVMLTMAGKQFLQYADRLLSMAEEAQSAVSGRLALEGSISIGAPETVFTYRIPPYLRRFRDLYPQARLYFRPMLDVDSLEGLKDGTLDIAFLLQGAIQAENYVVEPLVPETLLVVAGAGHPLAERECVSPSDLRGETILLTENGCGYRHVFEGELIRAGVVPLVKLEFSSVEAIKRCVMAGLGVAFLPEVAVREALEQGSLCALRWERSFLAVTQMVRRRDKWLAPILEAFLDVCRQMRTDTLPIP